MLSVQGQTRTGTRGHQPGHGAQPGASPHPHALPALGTTSWAQHSSQETGPAARTHRSASASWSRRAWRFGSCPGPTRLSRTHLHPHGTRTLRGAWARAGSSWRAAPGMSWRPPASCCPPASRARRTGEVPPGRPGSTSGGGWLHALPSPAWLCTAARGNREIVKWVRGSAWGEVSPRAQALLRGWTRSPQRVPARGPPLTTSSP